MTYLQLLDEIERVNIAIAVSKSNHLKNDYKKYLRKLYKEMHNYERFRGWKMKSTIKNALDNLRYIAERLSEKPSKADLIRYQSEIYKEIRNIEKEMIK